MKALLEKLRYWKWLIYLGILIVLVFVARYFIKRIGQSNKDKDLERLIIGHFEGQIRTAKEHIKASEKRRKERMDKLKRIARVLVFLVLIPVCLDAYFPLMLEPGEWRDLETSTNAVDYLMQERGMFMMEINYYQQIITAQSNEIEIQKKIAQKNEPSFFIRVIYPWIAPIVFIAGIMVGLGIKE